MTDSNLPTIADLEATIDRRFQLLQLLLELTVQQEAAIAQNHMNELMRVLGQKQRMVEDLVRASEKLKADRDQFSTRPKVSDEHRQRNEACEELHRELMTREEASERLLTHSRDEITDQLQQNDGARRAARGYGQSNQSHPSGGGTLDLSQ